MQGRLQKRLPSVLELTEMANELKKLTVIVDLQTGRERARRCGGGPGAWTLTEWSLLHDAVGSLREMTAGLRSSAGVASVSLSVGGKVTSRF